MADFANDRVQLLLRQAEQRLHGDSAASGTTSKTSKVAVGDAPISQPPSTKERLAVRTPHAEIKAREQSKDTAGSNWFDLPKTNLTPQFKRDWQVLRMRGVLDPKQQKKALRSSAPVYSQVGEIIAGPTDFHSARLTRKERKRTMLEHIMTEHDDPKLQSKYTDIQRNKASGKKAFYQGLVSQRRKRRA